jgi:hypothetical protein
LRIRKDREADAFSTPYVLRTGKIRTAQWLQKTS